MKRFLIITALAFMGCSLKQEPEVSVGGRFDQEYHGGRAGSCIYVIRDRKTGCEFLFLVDAGGVLMPNTCKAVTP